MLLTKICTYCIYFVTMGTERIYRALQEIQKLNDYHARLADDVASHSLIPMFKLSQEEK